jgi:transposase
MGLGLVFMPYRHISDDIRERCAVLISRGWVPEDIWDALGFSKRTYYRWLRNDDLHGSYLSSNTYTRGRPRTLTPAMTNDLIDLISEAPHLFLDEIQEWIAIAHDTGISKTSIHTIIRDCALTYKILRKAAAERDDEARRLFIEHATTHWVAAQMIFVDESSKDDRTIYRHYGRAPAGQRAITPAQFVRGERYSIVAALATEGYTGVRVVPGSVDGEEFLDFIITDVVRVTFVLSCSLWSVSKYLLSSFLA